MIVRDGLVFACFDIAILNRTQILTVFLCNHYENGKTDIFYTEKKVKERYLQPKTRKLLFTILFFTCFLERCINFVTKYSKTFSIPSVNS